MNAIISPKSVFIAVLLALVAGSAQAQKSLVIQSDHLVVSGGFMKVPAGKITVKSGATLSLHEPSITLGGLLQIHADGTVRGCGTLLIDVLNYGLIAANCGTGTTLTLGGAVTNHGTVRASHGSALDAASFVNHGTLDLMTGVNSLPDLLSGNGLVYTADSPPRAQILLTGDDVMINLPAPSGHTYQLQTCPDLNPENWFNFGPPQAGSDGVLFFIHTGGALLERHFYRCVITD